MTKKKKKSHITEPESWEFHFWAVLRTAAGETASQTALRNCSQEIKEESGYIGLFSAEKKLSKNNT